MMKEVSKAEFYRKSRHRMPTLEELGKALSHNGIANLKRMATDGEMFERVHEFDIAGQHYRLVWHVNAMSVFIGNAEVYCNGLSVDGCWPNRYKTNLNLALDGSTVLIIPLEEWDDRTY